jgi:16S rRNA (guanine527-N7)-methyltransferase
LAVCGFTAQSTSVYEGRVENFMSGAKKADLILSRAFMPWHKLLEFVSGKLAQQGRVVCLTLEDFQQDKLQMLPLAWELVASHCYSPSRLRPEKQCCFWAFRNKVTD